MLNPPPCLRSAQPSFVRDDPRNFWVGNQKKTSTFPLSPTYPNSIPATSHVVLPSPTFPKRQVRLEARRPEQRHEDTGDQKSKNPKKKIRGTNPTTPKIRGTNPEFEDSGFSKNAPHLGTERYVIPGSVHRSRNITASRSEGRNPWSEAAAAFRSSTHKQRASESGEALGLHTWHKEPEKRWDEMRHRGVLGIFLKLIIGIFLKHFDWISHDMCFISERSWVIWAQKKRSRGVFVALFWHILRIADRLQWRLNIKLMT